ncbi:hypothetical protein [Enterovirga rhinocerotis]|uniref:Uncharacterized protein n=1 Tax=Enterovirga rhinocerotis TaxID=1339210 RepID=A0A4R7C9X6_9HYPH|nr:hypothetical protein [Enterovirga rhinocerotis]TDR94165.1 hypothetical protein EV668_1442 [Enterovirga rhinocerotis]
MTISLDAALAAIARGNRIRPQQVALLCKRGLLAVRRSRPIVTEAGLDRLGFRSDRRRPAKGGRHV